MTLHDLCAHLLPPDDHLLVETLLMEEHGISLVLSATAPKAMCPACVHPACRVHGRYLRTLADLPWATTPVELLLWVRRFCCDTPTCARQTFTERLPLVAPSYARATARLRTSQTSTGLALGGSAGARHLARQGLPGSRSTLLRRVRALPDPQGPEPHVVGVDDWAWRKGHRYGTIVVDLERGCPIDVLEDRKANTVAAWFKAHSEVSIVARDRADAYASGVSEGAPQAIQVADRFHLFDNLADTLEEVFREYSRELDAINEARRLKDITLPDGSLAVPVPPTQAAPAAARKAEQSRARRLSQYEQVWEFHKQGWTAEAIAQRVGISSRTVFRFLRQTTFPERQPRRQCKASFLDPFKTYLTARWNAGCHNASRLFREMQTQGFTGHYGVVAAYVKRMRTAQGVASKPRTATAPVKVTEPSEKPLTPKSATWLVLRREEKREDAEADQELLAQIQAQHSELAKAIELSQDFAELVRQRQPEKLDGWLERATQSALKAFERFAAGLREDYEAVKAGVTLPWSTGPVEGHINRLKMLKRQMFGRANIDLLRLRVLCPT
jgi:transposase